jgi:hydroxypyruvate reductase
MNRRSIEQLRTDVRNLFLHGIHAANAYEITKKSLTVDCGSLIIRSVEGSVVQRDLKRFRRILITGFGKAAGPMAHAAEEILRNYLTEGLVITQYGHGVDLQKIRICEAGHPIPDANSLKGAQEVVHILKSTKEDDLVIVLISGGGSALCTLPSEGIKLADIQAITELLLKCGADIYEINTIRKHISQVKGGQLAAFAYPASLLALIISDVIDDRLDTIASGPTVPDATTFREAHDILDKYDISEKSPAAIRNRIRLGMEGKIGETPKHDDIRFRKTKSIIIAHNLNALRAIATRAKDMGYRPLMISSRISGETRIAAQVFTAIIRDVAASTHTTQQPVCVIAGGEMTVSVTGKGKGGRNQDFCLALAPLINGLDRVVALSAGTDGTDGPTDAAGVIVDSTTLSRTENLGLNIEQALANNDSHEFFKKSGDLLMTGPTRTNVMDIQIVLIHGV